MSEQADKAPETKNQPVVPEQGGGELAAPLADHRSEAVSQRKLRQLVDTSPQTQRAAQLQDAANAFASRQTTPIQLKTNQTGLPDQLKSGIEQLSGYSMDDVTVHYNSSRPTALNAHAYAQGTDIHIASGQEQHLPHEAWHIVQQKQGIVPATTQFKGVAVNDDDGLEREADVMGNKAMSYAAGQSATALVKRSSNGAAVQLKTPYDDPAFAALLVRLKALPKAEALPATREVLYSKTHSLRKSQASALRKILAGHGIDAATEAVTVLLPYNQFSSKDVTEVARLKREFETSFSSSQEGEFKAFFRTYGLNTPEQLAAYTDSLYETMEGTQQLPLMQKLSAMMTSINARLASLKYPTLEIVSKAGLENQNSANFNFRTWQMQIDPGLVVINAHLVNTLYHEARHSEQWFKMIIIRLLMTYDEKAAPAKREEALKAIVKDMAVPRNIVDMALVLDANEIVPPSQRMTIITYYESVYGKKAAHRTGVLTNLQAPGNYDKYKALPEEFDAWEVGANAQFGMAEKILALAGQIEESDDLDTVRPLIAKLSFYWPMVTGNKTAFLEFMAKKLEKWRTQISDLRKGPAAGVAIKILPIAIKHNRLAVIAGVTKLTETTALGAGKTFSAADWLAVKAQPPL